MMVMVGGTGTAELDLGKVAALSNCILGPAFLAMPFCFSLCGLPVGTALVALFAIATIMSNTMLLHSARLLNVRTYEDLTRKALGPGMGVLIELGIVSLMLGCVVAFCVVVSDVMPPFLRLLVGWDGDDKTWDVSIMTVLIAVVILPLCYGDVNDLKSAAGLAVFFYFVITMTLVQMVFVNKAGNGNRMDAQEDAVGDAQGDGGETSFEVKQEQLVTTAVDTSSSTSGVVTAFPIFSLAYACQTGVFTTYSESNISVRDMTRIVYAAVLVCSGVYASCGIFGVLAFQKKGNTGMGTHEAMPTVFNLDGNLLNMMGDTMFAATLRIGFAVSTLLSFPFFVTPCAVCMRSFTESAVAAMGYHTQQRRSVLPAHGATTVTAKRFFGWKMVVVILAFVISVLLPGIENVLQITGATAGSTVAYITPALIYLKLFGMPISGTSSASNNPDVHGRRFDKEIGRGGEIGSAGSEGVGQVTSVAKAGVLLILGTGLFVNGLQAVG